jgi:hypothetical protein
MTGPDVRAWSATPGLLSEGPRWHEERVYRIALDAGDPAGDTALADLQDEARRRLETADLVDRVVATGTKP